MRKYVLHGATCTSPRMPDAPVPQPQSLMQLHASYPTVRRGGCAQVGVTRQHTTPARQDPRLSLSLIVLAPGRTMPHPPAWVLRGPTAATTFDCPCAVHAT